MIQDDRKAVPQHAGRPTPWLLLAGVLLAIAACDGGDIAALPEAQALCGGEAGTPVTIDYTSRSWWDETGFHQTGSNGYLLAGWLDGTGYPTVRGFAEFSLAGISGCVASAALKVTPESNFGGDATEDFSLWQVTTDAATLNGDWTVTLNPAAYTDLGDGAFYGAFTVDTVNNLNVEHSIPLSLDAIRDITGRLGTNFIVGLRPDSLRKPPAVDEWVRFGIGGDATPTQLVLGIVP